ncbi:Glu-tRNA(Gln) amidotransferase subunit GatD [Nitrososphaera sp.]|uniref:Glu-tRNA(Gln) amidotransferase subunit GatD n=1 Tax=Nitrososphaera sp. TaxID=1971748 RepID=UPI0018184DCF|nr:Glu-tRNA(Gln) amidotransferase subunit GatD [Nitrososphaera sp.]NWG37029.1 Glu-tRNA(Gln) amidotransferase subunit GatD [Nitrososphaera sp.]
MESGGYRGAGLKILSKYGVSVGDTVRVMTGDGEMSGVIMPRYESASEDYIVIKLKSGYNTGVEVSKVRSLEKLAGPAKAATADVQAPAQKPGLPKIALISTGGTIASKIDYRTGGVRAALSASELYASVPELAGIASVDPEVLMSEYSENLKPEHWTAIAEKVAEKVKLDRYDGIVVSHGTDTMHYTAAALSFALQGLPVPVVLVGAQRSSDRPSSDAALNLIGATTFAAKAPVAGVFVAMHSGTSDDAVAVHVGTRVRKNHTSRRDAFESIDVTPVALVKEGKAEMQSSGIELAQRGRGKLDAKTKFDSRVMLLKYHPGFDPDLIEHAAKAGYKAIILEGTGLGHVSKDCFSALKKAVGAGVMVCMASQCIWGRVSMTVYDTGRDLLDIGVIPLSDMISETATAKAMWALANAGDPKKAMQENMAGEISSAIPL